MPERYRLPIVALVALVVVVAVGGAIVVIGARGSTSSPSPVATASPSPNDPTSTPEGVVRAFFTAYGRGRQTDDPTLVLPFVTGPKSDAYLSVAGFLNGQKAVGIASVLTVQQLTQFTVQEQGALAHVTFQYVEGGYDIDLKTGKPRESPSILPSYQVTATVHRVGSQWLVDSYSSRS